MDKSLPEAQVSLDTAQRDSTRKLNAQLNSMLRDAQNRVRELEPKDEKDLTAGLVYPALSDEERAEFDERNARRIEDSDLVEVSWWDINHVAEVDEDRGDALWQRVKDAARDELESGVNASSIVSGWQSLGPMEQARFLTIHRGLCEEWQPSGPTERTIIDMLCQVRHAYEFHLQRHMQYSSGMCEALTANEEERKKFGYWYPPRVSEMEAVEHEALMALRFQNQFVKLVRSLRDLRRYTSPVTINQPGQVNIGSQQVNVGRG